MAKQLGLNIYKGTRGGRRPGAGRPRQRSRGLAHSKREPINYRYPLHINFKVDLFIRNREGLEALRAAITKAQSHGIRIIHYSLQSNHIHLIIEASHNDMLTRGMRSLTNTFSKKLNRGRIQQERYHLHVLRSLQEVKNAIHYVLLNQARHTGKPFMKVDSYTSFHAITNLKELARAAKITLIKTKRENAIPVDDPVSYLSRKALSSHQTSSS